MHPSQAIRGARSQSLSGRRIVVGVTGSIAAVEVPRVIRELIRHGAEVRVVASPDALRIITEEALSFASGHPVVRELTGQVEHVSFLGPGEGRADLLLIAPATANTVSKIAHGIDDTAVTSFASVALGGGVPILIAPAMHAHMRRNPAVDENVDRLRGWGVTFIAPHSSEGEEKLATPEEIAAAVLTRLARGPWAGARVVVIGGASREPIDDVRSITNESSGATAVALATQAHFRGALVELWAGALQVPVPAFLAVRRWKRVADLVALARAEKATLRSAAAVFVPAALSDFTTRAAKGKISSRSTAALRLELGRAPKVLPLLRGMAPSPALLIGFKLEPGLSESRLAERAAALLAEAKLDGVVANGPANLGSRSGSFLLVRGPKDRHWISGSKDEVAGALLDGFASAVRPGGSLTSLPPRRRTPARRRST